MARPIRRIILHCTATPAGRLVTVDEIRGWHVRDNGWSDIGYHEVIDLDGVARRGRDPDGDGDVAEHVGAHTYGHNRDTYAIVYVGGTDARGEPKDTRTPAQRETLHRRVQAVRRRFGIPVDSVHGHNEFSAKACPSFAMDAFRREQRAWEAAQGALGRAAPAPFALLRSELQVALGKLPMLDLRATATAAAAKHLQRELDTPADAQLGPRTWAAVARYLAELAEEQAALAAVRADTQRRDFQLLEGAGHD